MKVSHRGRRAKGHSFERKVAAELRKVYGHGKRGLQGRDGADAPDVIDVPFWVECKHHRRVNIQKAMDEARDDAKRAKSQLPPIVVSRDNRKPTLVTLEWESFLVLLMQNEEMGNRVVECQKSHYGVHTISAAELESARPFSEVLSEYVERINNMEPPKLEDIRLSGLDATLPKGEA